MAIKVLVVDDEEIIRAGLKELFADSDVEIVADARNGDEFMEKCRTIPCDMALVDVRMEPTDGLAVLQRMQLEGIRLPVILVSAIDNPNYVARGLALGAAGYLLKHEERAKWLAIIRKVAAGESTWSREELRRITGAATIPRQSTDIDIPLTYREGEVVRLLAAGLTNREISQQLEISYDSVKEHVQHILRKLGVVDRTQAAIWAVRKKLV
jgi:DNA-binding NarL/FixJ family response regulator